MFFFSNWLFEKKKLSSWLFFFPFRLHSNDKVSPSCTVVATSFSERKHWRDREQSIRIFPDLNLIHSRPFLYTTILALACNSFQSNYTYCHRVVVGFSKAFLLSKTFFIFSSLCHKTSSRKDLILYSFSLLRIRAASFPNILYSYALHCRKHWSLWDHYMKSSLSIITGPEKVAQENWWAAQAPSQHQTGLTGSIPYAVHFRNSLDNVYF